MLINNRRASSLAAPAASAGESNYLASASDLMIGLLFVFIILVVVLALEQRRQIAAVAVTKDPRGEVVSSLGVALGPALGRSIQVDPSTGVISLPEDLLFSLGKATLQPEGEEALRKAATALAEVLPCFVANQKTPSLQCPHNKVGHEIDTIFIEGHTDNRPLNRPGYSNINLSLDRAQAVHKVLVTDSSLSPYRNKLDQPLFSFSAYADSRPLAGIDPGDSRNRRVDLRIVMAYQPLDVLMKAVKQQTGN
jgi:flagellar motor protein MotB